jgi:hypothetical protein
MRRERYPKKTSLLPYEGRQGREAPKGSLDGPAQRTPSLVLGAVEVRSTRRTTGDPWPGQFGHGACITVPSVSRSVSFKSRGESR